MTTETLSTSEKKKEVPKTKLALEEKYEEENKIVAEEINKEAEAQDKIKEKATTKLPTPTGWRMLVLPFKAKTKTKGGVYLSEQSIERSQVASTCGLILAMGPHCYDKEKFPEGPWCKKGDWVIFARYAGSRILIDGGEVRLLNDDEVLATVEDPEDIFHSF
jgi:co-chaperonin GroES (HSP10)|tara:strand:- start:45 stop:530 length:486 start_codon:yes stop_codon:yes gene_type:complete